MMDITLGNVLVVGWMVKTVCYSCKGGWYTRSSPDARTDLKMDGNT